MITFKIKNCAAWCSNLQTTADWKLWANNELSLEENDDLPPLKNIPAMQRRRLSRFAKLTFHCVLSVLQNQEKKLPCVFSSRHGDIHKTSKLLEDVACKEDLSPTQFGLSVHNAVAGLYSMFDDNKAAMTAVAAGEDTLLMAMVDAYAKMESQQLDQILLVYTDEVLPEKYQQYVTLEEKTIAIAMVLERSSTQDEVANIAINFKRLRADLADSLSTIEHTERINHQAKPLFQPLAFLQFIFGQENQSEIQSSRYLWQLEK